MSTPKTLLIFGSTGMVGQKLLAQALTCDDVGRVYAPTRKTLHAHPKLENPVVDFEKIPIDATWWQADAVLCALGTTIKIAGSKQQFRHIDYDYVMQIAALARKSGTTCFVLNSSLGADSQSNNFYLKVKGELERDLSKLGFSSFTIIRPSLLDAGKRPEQRLGEEIGLWFGTRMSSLIPKRYRPVTTDRVAKAMLNATLIAKTGTHIVESEQLHY
jgi:uncharacterized protein YbjT (DUF2867 family)